MAHTVQVSIFSRHSSHSPSPHTPRRSRRRAGTAARIPSVGAPRSKIFANPFFEFGAGVVGGVPAVPSARASLRRRSPRLRASVLPSTPSRNSVSPPSPSGTSQVNSSIECVLSTPVTWSRRTPSVCGRMCPRGGYSMKRMSLRTRVNPRDDGRYLNTFAERFVAEKAPVGEHVLRRERHRRLERTRSSSEGTPRGTRHGRTARPQGMGHNQGTTCCEQDARNPPTRARVLVPPRPPPPPRAKVPAAESKWTASASGKNRHLPFERTERVVELRVSKTASLCPPPPSPVGEARSTTLPPTSGVAMIHYPKRLWGLGLAFRWFGSPFPRTIPFVALSVGLTTALQLAGEWQICSGSGVRAPLPVPGVRLRHRFSRRFTHEPRPGEVHGSARSCAVDGIQVGGRGGDAPSVRRGRVRAPGAG